MAVEYPGELTAALAVEEEVVDGFGTGVVQGFISVTGVSDSLLNATSQEAAIQEALCELSPCPDGLESVVVVQESESTRMLLGGGVRQRRRRRLADLVDVQFEISTASGVEDDGEEQTGSQQAASVFNQMADPDALLMVASVFEVGVEDISFEELQYHEGAEVTIAAEFELASTKSDSGGLSVAVGTIVIIVMVIGVLVPLVGCILCCIKQHRREKKRREDAYYARTASHKAQVSAFYSAEDNGRAGSGRRESRSASIGSSGQFGDRATRTPSLGLGFKPTTRTPPVTSAGEMHADDPDKFSHTNPMLNNKRPVAQNVSFGEALKNHYQEE